MENDIIAIKVTFLEIDPISRKVKNWPSEKERFQSQTGLEIRGEINKQTNKQNIKSLWIIKAYKVVARERRRR